jgi:hypothetical protein
MAGVWIFLLSLIVSRYLINMKNNQTRETLLFSVRNSSEDRGFKEFMDWFVQKAVYLLMIFSVYFYYYK